eukprot:6183870-Pleurochrysis_carterae.AAC.1
MAVLLEQLQELQTSAEEQATPFSCHASCGFPRDPALGTKIHIRSGHLLAWAHTPEGVWLVRSHDRPRQSSFHCGKRILEPALAVVWNGPATTVQKGAFHEHCLCDANDLRKTRRSSAVSAGPAHARAPAPCVQRVRPGALSMRPFRAWRRGSELENT